MELTLALVSSVTKWSEYQLSILSGPSVCNINTATWLDQNKNTCV